MDEQLRAQVLEKLGMTNGTQEQQDAVLYSVEVVANQRIALVVPELLSKEQLDEVEAKRGRGESEDQIADWIESQVPQYTEMVKATILDVADEILAHGGEGGNE